MISNQSPAANETSSSSGEQNHTASTTESSLHLSNSSPDKNSTFTPVKIHITEPSDSLSITSIKNTRIAHLVDTTHPPMHIVVTPKAKLYSNTVAQNSVSTVKPMSIIFVADEEIKSIPIKNKQTNNIEINSVTPITVSTTSNPFSANKIQDKNKSIPFKINLSNDPISQKETVSEKNIPSSTPSNKLVQVKSVTVISNSREEISIRPHKINTAYTNVTPKSKSVTVIKTVTPKGEHGKAILINMVSSTVAPKTRQKYSPTISSTKNISFTTTPKSVTSERSLSSNTIIPITPAPKTSSKLVSVSLKSAVLDLSPPVTTPKTRPSTIATTTTYNPYNSLKTTSARTNKFDLNANNRYTTTALNTNKSDINIPISRPTTTTDRPYPVFVPELHSSSTTTKPSNQQQVPYFQFHTHVVRCLMV